MIHRSRPGLHASMRYPDWPGHAARRGRPWRQMLSQMRGGAIRREESIQRKCFRLRALDGLRLRHAPRLLQRLEPLAQRFRILIAKQYFNAARIELARLLHLVG